jgi:hypothetical protein
MTALPAPSMAQRHARSLEGYLTPKVGGPRARTVSQSLLGGQESVLPFGIGLQEFVPFSPYVGEEAGAMVREGQETDSGLTTGLGLGLGALQAFPVVKPLARGAKAAGKALGPKAAEMAEGYLLKSGLAPSVIKPKGGNWLAGTVEKQTKPLRSLTAGGSEPADALADMRRIYTPEETHPDLMRRIEPSVRQLEEMTAVNNWVDTKLNKYIKNEMGTPEDPVRALAERGVTHLQNPPPETVGGWTKLYRKEAGFPEEGLGQSPQARDWENITDRLIASQSAGKLRGALKEYEGAKTTSDIHGGVDRILIRERVEQLKDTFKNTSNKQLEDEFNVDYKITDKNRDKAIEDWARMEVEGYYRGNPEDILGPQANFRLGLTARDEADIGGKDLSWLEKVPSEQRVYGLISDDVSDYTPGFEHLIDELRNATRADSDLPANLRWKPEDLKKVTMAQAVERVAKINEWRAAQKVEADAAKARNPATFTFKEYPEQKMQWVELKAPSNETMPLEERKALIKKLQAEGRSPETWPRETLEEALKYEGDVMGHCVGGYCPDVMKGRSRIYSLRDAKGEPHVTVETSPGDFSAAFNNLTQEEQAAVRKVAGSFASDEALLDAMKQVVPDKANIPENIVQIKGKGNRAPKEEYLPMVQDFVKSGKWGSIGDYKNTKLRERAEMFDAIDLNKLKAAGHDVPEHLTNEEAKSFADKLYTIETGKNPETGQAYARGGLVTDTDAIAAKLKSTGMDDQKAFMQALRMADAKQEAHMAGGGLLKALKGSKTIGNYQALPLNLPRAPNLPPQEITKTAERVARQQMGQHVRQSDKIAANLAGRSVKEADKLQKMQVDIQPTKEVMQSVVVPEEVGQVRIALPGDISVADQMLMEVEGLPIGSVQEGGAKYGLGKQDLDDPRFWASNEGPAQIFQNKVTDLANMYETPEILAQHLAMGHDAMNFAQHFADANLLAIQASNVHPKAAEMFNKMIREGYEKKNKKTGERIRFAFPDFPGIENYKESYEAMQNNPEMRKWFNERMKTEKDTAPLGLPSGKEIEYAIMEPALRNMEHSLTGLSVGRMKPGASLIPGSKHQTYSHDIAGQALGHTKELTPIELAFPDASAYIKSTKRPQDFTPTIQKLFPHQVVDEQYINQLGEYYNRLKQIRGYKKGGEVKKTGLSVLNEAII